MNHVDLKAETEPPADTAMSDMIIDRDRLNRILITQNLVLSLIASGDTLYACLKEISNSLADLTKNIDYLIASYDSSSKEVIIATNDACNERLNQNLENIRPQTCEELDEQLRALIRAEGFDVVSRRPIHNHGGETLGMILGFSRHDQRKSGVTDDQVFDSMALLTGYAIESVRRTHALVAANERFAALTKSVPGVVYQRTVRPNGDIGYTYISDAAQDLFGVSPDEIVSDPQALFDCHGPEYYSTFRERLLNASRDLKLWDVEATIITRDGKRKYTHAIARPHQEADGSVVWNGVILDQTRIKEAELEAAAASTRTRDAIIESIPQAFALYDSNDKLVTWNSRYLDLYPELENHLSAGTSYADLLRAEIDKNLDVLSDDISIETRLAERLADHKKADHTTERQLQNGRWILVNEHRTDDGGTVALHTDVTELKDREAALERSNRELEAFASIASHDLQEPLRKIDAFGDRLKRKCQDVLDDDGKMYIDRMQNAVVRMRALINDLLDYSRVTTKANPFSPTNLQEIVQDVISDLEVRIDNVNGRVDLSSLGTIDADPTQLRQLFQNLIANAMKFHRPSVPPIVNVEMISTNQIDHLGPQRRQILVRDNGIGFDMKYAERIFGIFQRLHTKNEYEGTGVGLATCRKIVERHRGTIQVQSEIGQGTTFIIDLPIKQPTTLATGEEG